MKKLDKDIKEAIDLKKKIKFLNLKIEKSINLICDTFKKKGKILICGNGGSAAEAQHLAAEFLVRLNPKVNRKPLPIIPLAMDTSTLTACSNDYNFDKTFSRTFEALAKSNDLLICMSTSGNSKNIVNVLNKSKAMKIKSIAMLGSNGGKSKNLPTISIIIPSKNVARIQEEHLFLGHHIFNEVEKKL